MIFNHCQSSFCMKGKVRCLQSMANDNRINYSETLPTKGKGLQKYCTPFLEGVYLRDLSSLLEPVVVTVKTH